MVNIQVPLNVLEENTSLPIVYYIHGGAYNFGNNVVDMREAVMQGKFNQPPVHFL